MGREGLGGEEGGNHGWGVINERRLHCFVCFLSLGSKLKHSLCVDDSSGFALLVDSRSQLSEGFTNIYDSLHYLLRFSGFGCEHSLQFSASY